MIDAGSYHTLKVNRISDFGLYLANEEGDEVLLPNRYVSMSDKVGDMLTVFIYHDSEDRLVATKEQPLGVVGTVAYLAVVGKSVHGAFLDWGLKGKDLFMPNRNMLGGVEAGKKYVVYIYRDKMTGRAVATMALRGYITNGGSEFKRGQQVEGIVTQRLEIGFRVAIDNKYWGMIYNNQIFNHIDIGDKITAYVRKVGEDGRIDLSMQQEGYDEVKSAADKLLKLMRGNGGTLPITDKSEPDKVASITGMSKKVFKRATGYLLKRGELTFGENEIKLTEKQ